MTYQFYAMTIIALLARAWRTQARRTFELRMETLRLKAVFEATMFSKVLNHRGRIELRARKDNTDDLYAVL